MEETGSSVFLMFFILIILQDYGEVDGYQCTMHWSDQCKSGTYGRVQHSTVSDVEQVLLCRIGRGVLWTAIRLPILPAVSPFSALWWLCQYSAPGCFCSVLVCRTYFRRYGTGHMKQIVGVIMQRHDHQSVHNPAQGELQPREPREVIAQTWRDTQMLRLPQPILQVLLPRAPECQYWSTKLDYFSSFLVRNQPNLHSVNYISMPFYSEEAFHPLPCTP